MSKQPSPDTFAVNLTPEQARIIILALGVFLDRSIDFLAMIVDIDKKVNETISPASLDLVHLALDERNEMATITRELIEKSKNTPTAATSMNPYVDEEYVRAMRNNSRRVAGAMYRRDKEERDADTEATDRGGKE